MVSTKPTPLLLAHVHVNSLFGTVIAATHGNISDMLSSFPLLVLLGPLLASGSAPPAPPAPKLEEEAGDVVDDLKDPGGISFTDL